jgi:dTDP-4-dehydrorhamnose reductase
MGKTTQGIQAFQITLQYMSKPLIAVSGKNGQLGNELLRLSANYIDKFEFAFTDRQELDITDAAAIEAFFAKYQPAYFIHCAAYTAVDKAETEKDLAYAVNAEATGTIAACCSRYGTKLITISTDYVFNGKATQPYHPDHLIDPVNYYGYTKRKGEELALQKNEHSLVIRTSWVYSDHGHNFVKTMLRLMKERDEISVVNDQLGSPTSASDLAAAIMQVVEAYQGGAGYYGIYHYSNKGVISWYDFALAIRDMARLSCIVHPIPTTAYPTPAKRPAYSVLDTGAFEKDFGIRIPDWKTSLQTCISKLS